MIYGENILKIWATRLTLDTLIISCLYKVLVFSTKR